MDENRVHSEDQAKIDYVRNMLLPTKTDLRMMGKNKVSHHGLERIEVTGSGNESLYRALCRGLFEDEKEDDYWEIYELAIHKMGKDPEKDGLGFTMNPRHVLKVISEDQSVKIIVFNAIGKDIEFSPPGEITTEVAVLCEPTIDSLTQAYALKPITRVDQQGAGTS